MPATALVTSEQYLALRDEFDQHGNRIKDELIGGEIVKMPPASNRQDPLKNRISKLLTSFLDQNKQLGLESNVEIGTRVSAYDTFVPDVSVIRKSRFSDQQRIVQGPREIAVELVSPSDTVSHLKAKVNGSDCIEDRLLPGFSVPVSEFFDLH